jgi:hypothetical protein
MMGVNEIGMEIVMEIQRSMMEDDAFASIDP